jgi:phosphoserine aminotransferase
LQGGATAQFSAVPLSFLQLNSSHTADYLVTGYWSEKAAKEAEKYGKVNYVIPKQDKYTGLNASRQALHTARLVHIPGVPAENTWKLTENSSYFYYCSNETIHGVEFDAIPDVVPKDTTIVCDMSSNFLTRPVDLTKVK